MRNSISIITVYYIRPLFTAIFCIAIAFTHGFSQEVASVPVITNVDATVSIQPSNYCAAGSTGLTLPVTAGQQTMLTLQMVNGTTPIMQWTSIQSGTEASYSLFSISGKRLDISRQVIPQGIYLLSVKVNGKTTTSKVAHLGGKFNLNAVSGKGFSPNVLRKDEVCTWTLTATAEGYETVSYILSPIEGTNPVADHNIRPIRQQFQFGQFVFV